MAEPRPQTATAVDELAPVNLNDPVDQATLAPVATKAVIRIAALWQLNTPEICALLGGISDRTWYRMKGAPPATMAPDMLTRVSALVGIFKGLRLLFSQPLSDQWVKRLNRHPLFGGRTPLAAMIEAGIPKMLATRGYIDALRGGL